MKNIENSFIQDIYFVTFANKTYQKTLDRIRQQALDMNIFKHIFAWNENDLEETWFQQHSSFIKKNKRGYGYWIWKPQVIFQALGRIPKGSCLIYCDAGCTFNKLAKDKITDLAKLVRDPSHIGIIAFQLPFKEGMYTKMDLMNVVDFYDYDSRQVQAGISIWLNHQLVLDFLTKWMSLCYQHNYHLVDDSTSVAKNVNEFREHRHDQSIFSILMKQEKGLIIERWPNTVDYPIHTTRLKF